MRGCSRESRIKVSMALSLSLSLSLDVYACKRDGVVRNWRKLSNQKKKKNKKRRGAG
jgi:hypothetical protein